MRRPYTLRAPPRNDIMVDLKPKMPLERISQPQMEETQKKGCAMIVKRNVWGVDQIKAISP